MLRIGFLAVAFGLAATSLIAIASPSSAGAPSTSIVTDGRMPRDSVPQVIMPDLPDGNVYTIDQALGFRPEGGKNLFHSFEYFDLGSGDTAEFTANLPTENVISRVTGGLSEINGTIKSAIGSEGTGANFYLLNPAGVMFGPDASVDVLGSFHVGAADFLWMEDGTGDKLLAFSPDSRLATTRPKAFGFLNTGSTAPLRLDGTSLFNPQGVSLAAGVVEIRDGAFIEVRGGDLTISAETRTVLSGVNALGEGSQLSGAALGPSQAGGSIVIRSPIVELEDGAGIVSRSISPQAGSVSIVADARMSMSNSSIEVSGDEGGAIEIETPHLEILNASAVGIVNREGGLIALEVGDLELRAGSSVVFESVDFVSDSEANIRVDATGQVVLADAGTRISSDVTAGLSGSIRVEASVVRLENGAEISSVSEFGQGGSVLVIADEVASLSGSSKINVSGEEGGSVGIKSPYLELRDGSTISAGAQSGQGGVVALDVGELQLRTESHVSAAKASGTGSVSRIEVGIEGGDHVTRLIEIAEGSSVEANAILGATSGDIILRAANGQVVVAGEGSKISSDSEGGLAGSIRVEARNVRLDHGATISSVTREGGTAGDISIVAEETIALYSGASISSSEVVPLFPVFGRAGSVTTESRTITLSDGSSISSNAQKGPGGNIAITATDLVLLEKRSEISATVADGTGGDITISRPDAVVLRDGSLILAEATGDDPAVDRLGGIIRISTEGFLKSPDSVVSAKAGVGIDGRVVVTSPGLDLEGGLAPLTTEFLDAAALLRPSCAARRSGTREGSFVVGSRYGTPPSPEDPLLFYPEDVLSDASVEATGSQGSAELQLIQEGHEAGRSADRDFREGRIESAAGNWAKASERFADAGVSTLRIRALFGLGRSQHALGHYIGASEAYRDAMAVATAHGDDALVAGALVGLGNAQLALGNADEARSAFDRAADYVHGASPSSLGPSLLNSLGNYHLARDDFAAALEAYEESASQALDADDSFQVAAALSNAARAASGADDGVRALELAERSLIETRSLPVSRNQVTLLIHTAKVLAGVGALDTARRAASLLEAHAALDQAARLASESGADRLLSYALGNLGTLYREEHRFQEALYLTMRALRASQRAEAAESLYRWHWQEGQILWSLGKANEAVRSYDRAVSILEETRQKTLSRHGAMAASFRHAVAPAYLGLVDALLQGSEMVQDPIDSQRLLIEARATMERLNAAELRDYFRDECLAELEARTRGIDAIEDGAAVIYPIPLPDRTELLVTLPDGIRHYTVAVGSARLTEEARQFRRTVNQLTNNRYRPHAQQLYEWLVRPLEADLASAGIDTLVFVPDGVLRTVPIAALHDGKEFLVERFAIAVTPGLELIDPQPLNRQQPTALLLGLSESVQGYPALPYVEAELAEAQRAFGGDVLLNRDFVAENVERELRRTQPSIVHIASHAEFTGDAATSFFLTYDGKLRVDRLEELIGVARFREEPLELLVLSACNTGAGDDRAALGLAGIAIRAGARSALGSLWSIGDEATSHLIGEFYSQLGKPQMTKAEALRRAQQALLSGDRFRHPGHWAPFLMIGNWL